MGEERFHISDYYKIGNSESIEFSKRATFPASLHYLGIWNLLADTIQLLRDFLRLSFF